MEHKLSFPSKAENLNLVEKLIDDVCELNSVNEDYYGNILIAITEAVNNAIHHGNKSNPDKKVNVSYTSTPEKLLFTIQDEGPGFDFENLPDPTDPQNIEKPHGRGVFLMRNLSDEIEFSDGGSTVVMKFKVAASKKAS
ncbi:MAG: ATP-binding protein [Flavobacteriales bacterium]